MTRSLPTWTGKTDDTIKPSRGRSCVHSDLTGMVFGEWTVLRFDERPGGRTKWVCRCTCGVERAVAGIHLVRGASRSCGCFRPKLKRKARDHPLYKTYWNIVQRTENQNNASFHNYGGRGIKMCERWRKDFWSFVEDMGDKPTPMHTIEREDNDLGYEPRNCKWASRKQQMRNMRRNRMVTFNGCRMTLVEASELSGVNYGTAKYRLDNGFSDVDAFK